MEVKTSASLLERLVSLADLMATVAEEAIDLAIDQLSKEDEGMLDSDIKNLKQHLKKSIPRWPIGL